MGKALIICPTRGRPESAARLIDAWGSTAVASDLMLCIDEDDPALQAYMELRDIERFHRGMLAFHTGEGRTGLADWTNRMARPDGYQGDYDVYISLGDDHVPQTQAWDRSLAEAVAETGGGFAYPDDGLQHENLPTCWAVSVKVVTALGWMCLPGLKHMYVDAAVKHLGISTGLYRYLPDVKVKHLHYTSGLSPHDATYADSAQSEPDDQRVFYDWWMKGGLARDAKTVREACRR